MTEPPTLGPRMSARLWALYQSEILAPKRTARGRDGFYLGMLKDDLRKKRHAYDLSLSVEGVDSRRAADGLLALLYDFDRTGHARDPAALVCDFASSLLEESLEGDQMLLELYALTGRDNRARSRRNARSDPSPHPSSDPADRETDTLPCLAYVPGWSVTEHRLELTQLATEHGQRATSFPSSRVHRLRMRQENRETWMKAVHGLRQVDAAKVTGGDLDRFSWTGYAFSEHVAAQNLAVAATTSTIGWDARGTFAEMVTSPYVAFRRLRFARFWVETVEDCVSFLNHFTSSPDLYAEGAFTFTLSGLPSSEELADAMGALRSGSLSFEAAHSTYLSPRYSKRQS